MTPKEKAEELVSKMQSNLFSDGHYDAKQCAAVVVDEMLSLGELVEDDLSDKFYIYWKEVRKEINNL
jgi:transcription initiation factor IIE alpha subunit